MADYDYDDRHNGTDEIDLSCVQKNKNVKKQEHIGGCVKLRVRMTRSCSEESQVCVYKRRRASW